MIPGISTACFYPEETETALKRLADREVRSTEVFLNSSSELEPHYLRELKKVADSGGTRILSVHPFTSGMEPMLFFTEYPRRFEDGRDFYKRYYQACQILGADIVVFHGGTRFLSMEWSEYYHRFAVLMEDAGKEGVRLCHENVERCIGRIPLFFQEMRRQLPQARFVLDVKQVVRAGQTVDDFLCCMKGAIAHLHISDHDANNDCLNPGTGSFNMVKFLSNMRLDGFDGGVIVELYRENFGEIVEVFEGYQQVSTKIDQSINMA